MKIAVLFKEYYSKSSVITQCSLCERDILSSEVVYYKKDSNMDFCEDCYKEYITTFKNNKIKAVEKSKFAKYYGTEFI